MFKYPSNNLINDVDYVDTAVVLRHLDLNQYICNLSDYKGRNPKTETFVWNIWIDLSGGRPAE